MQKSHINWIAETVLFVVYIAALAAVMMRHEPWVDEVRAWQIVQDSRSIPGLLAAERHEIHPALWYLALYAVKLLHGGIAGMQACHWLFAAGVAGIVIYRSPFPLWLRIALLFSSVLFYEYGVISRNYAPGVLFLFAACSVQPDTSRKLVLTALLLFLAMQSNVFACLIAAVFGAMLVGQAIGDRKRAAGGVGVKAIALTSLLLLAGAAASLAQSYPPADFASPIPRSPLNTAELAACTARIARGLIGIPVPTVHFWNTSIVTATLGTWGAAFLAVVLAVLIVWLLKDKPFAAAFFIVETAAVFLSCLILETRAARHIDHFFIVMVMAFWLAARDKSHEPAPSSRRRSQFLAVMACLQIAGGLICAWFDWQYPFDQSARAAACIASHGLSRLPMFGYQDYNASAVGAYLDRPIYYPQSGRAETFVRQVRGRAPALSASQLGRSLALFVASHRSGSVLILSPAVNIPPGNPTIQVIGQFGEPCITGITYTIVRVLPLHARPR